MKKFAFAIILMHLILCFPVFSLAKMLGPYSGRVIDSQTGESVKGAAVLFYWTKFTPDFHNGRTEAIDAVFSYTDAQGRYQIPRIFAYLGLITVFESTWVIVYEPGYQAYIRELDYLHRYAKPDPLFKAKGNLVQLDRVPPNFDQKKHVDTIEDSLWLIDRVDDRFAPEVAEFLRRLEWEDRR